MTLNVYGGRSQVQQETGPIARAWRQDGILSRTVCSTNAYRHFAAMLLETAPRCKHSGRRCMAQRDATNLRFVCYDLAKQCGLTYSVLSPKPGINQASERLATERRGDKTCWTKSRICCSASAMGIVSWAARVEMAADERTNGHRMTVKINADRFSLIATRPCVVGSGPGQSQIHPCDPGSLRIKGDAT
jgi:hypothetical protein